ncbi:MAG: ribonuclease P protein component [Gammaproteobacteria bacterium]|nr:ribonuclease P protein component [Gammaproteobacteria bacterium]
MTYKLRREQRLTHSIDIQRVLKDPIDRKYYKVIRVVWRMNGFGFPRFTVSVAKRHVKSAVRRNLIKRVIREWFRLNQSELPDIDLVFLTKSPTGSSKTNQQLKEELRLDLFRFKNAVSPTT